jgi:hypothetical protein
MTELQTLIKEIHTLDQELGKFERKYGLLSDTFYAWYQSGEEPEDPAWVQDLALWAGTYQLKLRREKKYQQLLAQALTQQRASDLMRDAVLVGTN